MLRLDPNQPPTCGAVISGQEEKICGEAATDLINMADAADPSKIIAVVLVCAMHDAALSRGESLIFVSHDKKDRISVTYKTKEE